MGLRPGKCYRNHQRPYTRVSTRRPRKSFVKGVPKSKVTGFEYGQKADYPKVVYITSDHSVQIRSNSIESARVAVVRELEKNVGKGFFFRVRIYPHQVLRENVMATGAGADRFQTGMRQSFGKPIGTAAVVKAGQKLMEIRVNDSGVIAAKKSFRAAMHKLPTTCKIRVEDFKGI
ncbi:MAG: 50S ribosomal protein L16 [Candidatus Aenigmarchaeota archaeon]|nr:50S ribosomal protein L16 [Candidatus Aenigmarchaeota archaeon]